MSWTPRMVALLMGGRTHYHVPKASRGEGVARGALDDFHTGWELHKLITTVLGCE
jgi:hypothetical protein